LKPLEVVDVEIVIEKTAGGASAVGSENELPESQVSQRSAQGTAIVAKKRSVFAQIQMEWSQSLEQAASAVKAAAQNLGSVHEKWMEIGRQRQEAEYNAQQLKKIAKEEEAQKQARQVWLQVEKDTSRKKAESRMAENAEAVRLREQTVELLRHEAELREAEELEITAVDSITRDDTRRRRRRNATSGSERCAKSVWPLRRCGRRSAPNQSQWSRKRNDELRRHERRHYPRSARNMSANGCSRRRRGSGGSRR
jgi:hypothetical protein